MKFGMSDLDQENLTSSNSDYLLFTAGSFQERVWVALAKNIGPGQIVSYGELAKMVNSPGLLFCLLSSLS